MSVLGIMTRRELQVELTEARNAITELAVRNYHLQRALSATQKHVESCKGLIEAYARKEAATEHFLAVLQGEQIATNDNND